MGTHIVVARHVVRRGARALMGASLATWLAGVCPAAAQAPKFFPDDPLKREPSSQDASKAATYEVDLTLELLQNQFLAPGDRTKPSPRALNVNTADEVPDSAWFTNRIGARPLSLQELVTGPNGTPPDPSKWTIVRTKSAGASPGFTATDAAGDTWFISFDAPGAPESSTGAVVIANKIFWALGYHQAENFLTRIDRAKLSIGEGVTIREVRTGNRRPFTQKDLDAVFARAQASPDGTFRAVASRQLAGKVIGNFRYFGTRSDDPNDVIPHEHRRELRALKVFGAWTNLVDMKAGNTLDVLVDESGHQVVRHYLQDVGSTFGAGANGPHDYDEGWEWLFEGGLVLRRLVTLGLYMRPWQTVDYPDIAAIGRFEGDEFDPLMWRGRVPVAAHRHLRGDDGFWAARRVAAFTDEAIRAIVKTAQFSDPNAEKVLGDIIIKRRDKVLRAYLPVVNPLADFSLTESGELRFTNVAVDHKVAEPPARGYQATWYAFDNATQKSDRIGETAAPTGAALQAPAGVSRTAGSYVRVDVAAVGATEPSWATPVHVYFKRGTSGWSLVGVER